jgi:hypothetical protein
MKRMEHHWIAQAVALAFFPARYNLSATQMEKRYQSLFHSKLKLVNDAKQNIAAARLLINTLREGPGDGL